MNMPIALAAALLVLPVWPRALAADAGATGQTARATETRPPAPPADTQMEKLINLGYKALQTAQSSTAISFFEKVLKQEPQNKRARAGLATVMIQTDKHQAAIALLEPMIKEFPDDYTLKNNLAWVLATTRDPALRNGPRAIQLAQDALLSAPGDGHVWSTLAEAYAISGHYKKALRSAEQALQLGRASNMEAQLVEDYRQQVERCRKAAETTAILE